MKVQLVSYSSRSGKCFDTVNKTILLNKLQKYGIGGESLVLMENNSTNRYRYSTINKKISVKSRRNMDVP